MWLESSSRFRLLFCDGRSARTVGWQVPAARTLTCACAPILSTVLLFLTRCAKCRGTGPSLRVEGLVQAWMKCHCSCCFLLNESLSARLRSSAIVLLLFELRAFFLLRQPCSQCFPVTFLVPRFAARSPPFVAFSRFPCAAFFSQYYLAAPPLTPRTVELAPFCPKYHRSISDPERPGARSLPGLA